MPARFAVGFDSKDAAPFIIELHDEAKIHHARRIVAGSERLKVHVHGTIVAKRSAYNPGYSFHLDPMTIEFFELAAEVCDADPHYVEAHLGEIGGAFLPDAQWCPWASRVEAEIT